MSPKPLKPTLIHSLGLGPPHVADARGYRVRLFKPSATDKPHAELRIAERKSVSRNTWGNMALAGVLVSLMAVLYSPALVRFVRGGFSDSARWLPVMVVLLYLAMLLNLWNRRRWTHSIAIAHAFVAAGHCASCGYAMRGLVPEPDGTTVCPECAAAWNMPNPQGVTEI